MVRTVEGDLGRPLATLFAEFAPVPLASASVSQVHKARLPDGRIVAVKVRRPDVVELCTFDLVGDAAVGARLLNAHPVDLDAVAGRAAVEEFGRAIFAQLDFRIEARNNRRFRDNFRATPTWSSPRSIEALSSERDPDHELHRRGRRSSSTPRDAVRPEAGGAPRAWRRC